MATGITLGVFIKTSKTKDILLFLPGLLRKAIIKAELLLLFCYCCMQTLTNSWELKNTSKQTTILIIGFCESFVA